MTTIIVNEFVAFNAKKNFNSIFAAQAVGECALPIIMGIEEANLENINQIYLLTNNLVAFDEFKLTVKRRIWETSEEKRTKTIRIFNSLTHQMARQEFGIKNARCFAVENFLTDTECTHLISIAEVAEFQSIAWEYAPSYRNCQRVVIKDERISQELWKRLKKNIKREDIEGIKPFGFGNTGIWIPKFVNSSIRFTKYQQDNHFKPHRDGGFVINDDLRSVFTIIVYLNDSFEGGSTVLYESKEKPGDNFEEGDNRADKQPRDNFIEHIIAPKTGMALVFNHDLLHEATPITSPPPATKYILRTDVISCSSSLPCLFLISILSRKIICERIDCRDLTSYKEYRELPEYQESERFYQRSIEEQKKGNPAESTEYFIKALELQAKLASLDQHEKRDPLVTQINHNSLVPMLSYEIWLKIFEYFPEPRQLLQLGMVCKYFKYISEDNIIWRNVFFSHFPLQKQSYVKMVNLAKANSTFEQNQFIEDESGVLFSWKVYFKNHYCAASSFEVASFYVTPFYTCFEIPGRFLAKTPINSAGQEVTSNFGSRKGASQTTRGDITSHVGRVAGHYWSAGSGYKEYLVGSELTDSMYSADIAEFVALVNDTAYSAVDYLMPLLPCQNLQNYKRMRYFNIVPLRSVISWVFNCSYPVYLAIKNFPVLFAVPLAANNEIKALTKMFLYDLNVSYLLLQSTAVLAMYATEYHSSIVIHFDKLDLISVVPVSQLTVVKNESFLVDYHSMQDLPVIESKIKDLVARLAAKGLTFQNVLISGEIPGGAQVDFVKTLERNINNEHSITMPVVHTPDSKQLVITGSVIYSQQMNIKQPRLEILSVAPRNPFSNLYFASGDA